MGTRLAALAAALSAFAGSFVGQHYWPSGSAHAKTAPGLVARVTRLERRLSALDTEVNSDWNVNAQAYGIRHELLRVCGKVFPSFGECHIIGP